MVTVTLTNHWSTNTNICMTNTMSMATAPQTFQSGRVNTFIGIVAIPSLMTMSTTRTHIIGTITRSHATK